MKRILSYTLPCICVFLLWTACETSVTHSRSTTKSTPTTPSQPPERPFDVGNYHRAVSTNNPAAQKMFDQALTFTYGFNHDEAIRSYKEAARLDPKLAIAWWGVAYCYGPHINFPILPEEKAKLAWEALTKAQDMKSHASPVEQALIDALATRYANPAPADRAPLDKAYAAAMKSVHQQYPDDPDVATLYAESLMDLQPWDLWTLDGQPKGNATEIVAVLEKVLAKHPRHPGATHFYIHAVEASPTPNRALASADVLRDLVPIASHLRHMPSHIYARVGQWPDACESNRKAIKADAEYRRLSPNQGFYMVYMQHNHGFLSFACMMAGRSEEAIQSSHDAVTLLPPEWIKENATVIDGYLTIHMDALKRFGKWDEILALPAPPEYLPFTTAMWRANRTVAYAAKGQIDAALAERGKFEEAAKKVPPEAMAQQNPAHNVLKIASHVVDGEVAFARRDYDKAITELKEGVKLEDNLRYIEPPDWIVPVRHTLGAVYLDAGKLTEAEATYRDDLARLPNNGWSLLGLAQTQEKQGKSTEAAKTREQLATAWSQSTVKPRASCMCAPAKK